MNCGYTVEGYTKPPHCFNCKTADMRMVKPTSKKQVMKPEKTLGTFIDELLAVQAEHGPDIPVHIDGGHGDGIRVKTTNKGMYRGDNSPVVRAIIDFE